MKFSEFVPKIHVAYKGKAAAKAPAAGTAKYEVYMSVTNDKLESWSRDKVYNWNSLYNEVQTSVSDVISLDDDFIRMASDNLYITTEQGLTVELNEVRPSQRRSFVEGYYIAGNDPQLLRFTSDVIANHDGEVLEYDTYNKPPVIKTASSLVVCDSYEWLAYAVAAELARNDPAKDDQFGNLSGLASAEYSRMAKAATPRVNAKANRIRSSYPRMGRSW